MSLGRFIVLIGSLGSFVLGSSSLHAEWSQSWKLVGTDGGVGDSFGHSVGISGTKVIVGALFEDSLAADSGAAYLFDARTGSQLYKLKADDAAESDWFGHSVAISGNYAIVGANLADAAGVDSGAAYVFDVNTGAQLHKLVPADAAAGDWFGGNVAIDGNIAVVGAIYGNTAEAETGAAYVFDVTTGQEIAKSVASNGAAGDGLGGSVSIDGDTVFAGAGLHSQPALYAGTGYLFNALSGQQIREIQPTDLQANDLFGSGSSIRGNTVIVGANTWYTGPGAAYLFDAAAGTQFGKLTGDGTAVGYFAGSVDLLGNVAAVSDCWDDDSGADAGAIYLFDVNTLDRIAKLYASNAQPGDWFGWRLALDKEFAVVSARHDDTVAADAGAVYVFIIPEPSAFTVLFTGLAIFLVRGMTLNLKRRFHALTREQKRSARIRPLPNGFECP